MEIDSGDNSLSSRIELLRRLLVVLFADCRRRLITFFEISHAEREESPGSISIHFLSFIGMMLGKSTGSLVCGFAFAFDMAAKSFINQL